MKFLAASALFLLFVGCGPNVSNPTGAGNSTVKPSSTSVNPDNTAVNERDRNSEAKTPLQQNENNRDLQITADIRKAVLATEGMSTNAKNSKIITADGKVTLRGPVASAEEKTKIEDIAKDIAGKGNVTNELEVTK